MRALLSLLHQTTKPCEVVVVDNGINKVGESFFRDLDLDVKYVQMPPRIGASRARNMGVKKSCCKYIGFLDDDDYFNREYIEVMLDNIRLRGGDKIVLYGSLIEDETLLERVNRYSISDFERDSILKTNPGVSGQNMFLLRSSFLDIGDFDTNLRSGEDRDYAIRAIDRGYDLLKVSSAHVYATTQSANRLSENPLNKLSFLYKYISDIGYLVAVRRSMGILGQYFILKFIKRNLK